MRRYNPGESPEQSYFNYVLVPTTAGHFRIHAMAAHQAGPARYFPTLAFPIGSPSGSGFPSFGCRNCKGSTQKLADIACHVIGCHLNQVHNSSDDVTGAMFAS